MFVAQFKLDHTLEKNNECIIYRASKQEQKFMVIQLNRQPILRISQYFEHFQRELAFIFKHIPPPTLIPQDFPFKLPPQEVFNSQEVEFPAIVEIHQTDLFYFLILTNCLDGTITSQQLHCPKVFRQVYTLYDIYYQAFRQRTIQDRDFNFHRLYWSNGALSLIDFGFQLLQKPQRPLPWTIKLGALFNELSKHDKPSVASKRLVYQLLNNKISWEEIKDSLEAFVELNPPPESFEKSRASSIYARTTPLTMEPQEFLPIQETALRFSQPKRQACVRHSVADSKVIRRGNQKLSEHFERIKKSLSPALFNRSPYRIAVVESYYQESPNARSVSRKSYQVQRSAFNYTKPIEQTFEYKQPSDPVEERVLAAQPAQPLQGKQPAPTVLPVVNTPKAYVTPRTTPKATKQDIWRSVQLEEEMTYCPSIMEKHQPKERPKTAFQKARDLQDPNQKQPITLLRKSTRELQQPDQRSHTPQINREQTFETIEKSSVSNERQQQALKVRQNSYRLNSARRSSNASIQEIQLMDDNKLKQNGEAIGQKEPLKEVSVLKVALSDNNQTVRHLNSEDSSQNSQFPQVNQPLQQPKYGQTPKYSASISEKADDFSAKESPAPVQQSKTPSMKQGFSMQIQQNTCLTSPNEQYSPSGNQLYQKGRTFDSFSPNVQNHGGGKKTSDEQGKPVMLKKPMQERVESSESISQQKKTIEGRDSKSNSNSNRESHNQFTSLEDDTTKPDQGKKAKAPRPESPGEKKAKAAAKPQQIVKISEEEENMQLKLYSDQLKKYDIIGTMVSQGLKYFQALRTFWIIPLFLCFKRMINFRKLLENSIRDNVSVFEIDMARVQANKKLKQFYEKLVSDNRIVMNELQTLFTHCQKRSQQFEAKELAKIEKYLNMDIDQDLKDIYFIYLYSQIFKTAKEQQQKLNSDKAKLKENLKLQLNAIASVVISEVPFSTDNRFFDLREYQESSDSLEKMQELIRKLEQTVQTLKQRLNNQGIRI